MKVKLLQPLVKLMGSCDDITLLIEKSLSDEISFTRRLKIKIHLMGCIYCRRYENQAKLVSKALDSFNEYSLKEAISLSPEKKSKIIQTLKNQKNN
jgi:hypothetical protein